MNDKDWVYLYEVEKEENGKSISEKIVNLDESIYLEENRDRKDYNNENSGYLDNESDNSNSDILEKEENECKVHLSFISRLSINDSEDSGYMTDESISDKCYEKLYETPFEIPEILDEKEKYLDESNNLEENIEIFDAEKFRKTAGINKFTSNKIINTFSDNESESSSTISEDYQRYDLPSGTPKLRRQFAYDGKNTCPYDLKCKSNYDLRTKIETIKRMGYYSKNPGMNIMARAMYAGCYGNIACNTYEDWRDWWCLRSNNSY
tara:strand:+ start:409 stop:1200 length:792 start_codon:yes stop_codon:yes gene_type:complete